MTKTPPASGFPELFLSECRKRGESCCFTAPPSRSALTSTSSVPLVRDIGETMAVDFTEVEAVGLIHMVDVFRRVAIATRCTAGGQRSGFSISAPRQWYRTYEIPNIDKIRLMLNVCVARNHRPLFSTPNLRGRNKPISPLWVRYRMGGGAKLRIVTFGVCT